MENVYKFYKDILEQQCSFSVIDSDIRSLLDKDEYTVSNISSEIVSERAKLVEKTLEDYFSFIYNVDPIKLKKQIKNCNNFRFKNFYPKLNNYQHKEEGQQFIQYYVDDVRVLSIYDDGYIYYGGWKSEMDYINSSVLDLKGVWPNYYERYIVKEDDGSWSCTAKGRPVYWRDFERGCNRLGIEFKYAK